MSKVIVVAVSGWVFIGEQEDTAGAVVLKTASVIRAWGTTNGLGEIALNGPTENTVLDPCGTVALPKTSVIAIIACREGT